MITDACGDAAGARLPAKLFSSGGKLAVTLSRLSALDAIVSAETSPAEGSIAVMVRNGLRICGTVAPADEGSFRLDFERPINAREQELFWGLPLDLTAEAALPPPS